MLNSWDPWPEAESKNKAKQPVANHPKMITSLTPLTLLTLHCDVFDHRYTFNKRRGSLSFDLLGDWRGQDAFTCKTVTVQEIDHWDCFLFYICYPDLLLFRLRFFFEKRHLCFIILHRMNYLIRTTETNSKKIFTYSSNLRVKIRPFPELTPKMCHCWLHEQIKDHFGKSPGMPTGYG